MHGISQLFSGGHTDQARIIQAKRQQMLNLRLENGT